MILTAWHIAQHLNLKKCIFATRNLVILVITTHTDSLVKLIKVIVLTGSLVESVFWIFRPIVGPFGNPRDENEGTCSLLALLPDFPQQNG